MEEMVVALRQDSSELDYLLCPVFGRLHVFHGHITTKPVVRANNPLFVQMLLIPYGEGDKLISSIVLAYRKDIGDKGNLDIL